jgi:hypothetical protein
MYLFKSGKKPIEVAIELDISARDRRYLTVVLGSDWVR